MSKRELVSVITVCYNSAATIARTIESVLQQTWPEIEYIIVDGQSPDDTLKIVRRYEPMFQGRMRVISEKDTGIYDAMNKGIRAAHGRWIGIINSDDYYESDAVEVMMGYENNTPWQVRYGAVRIWKNGAENSTIHYSHLFLPERMICHPACFVTREVYKKYGLFNTRYKSAADYELMLRLFQRKEVVFIPVKEVLANFAVGGMCDSARGRKDKLHLLRDRRMISGVQFGVRMITELFRELIHVG